MSAPPRVIYATATPCVIIGRDAFSGRVYAWNVSDPDRPVVVGTFGTVRATLGLTMASHERKARPCVTSP